MNFKTYLKNILLGLIITFIAIEATAETTINIGILAFRPAAEVQERWQPLINYFNQTIPGYSFRSRAFGYKDLEAAIAKRTVDFVLTNPSHYMLMTYRNGLSSPLATIIQSDKNRNLSRFGGVIITRADNDNISFIKDLRKKRIAAVTKGSLGGYQTQAVELYKSGLTIPKHVKLLQTGMPHDLVVNAVLEGRADAGFVRTGILEDMAEEGKLDLTRIKIIAQKNEKDFPLLLSTQLYPEWPLAAMPNVEDDLLRQVAAVVLSLPHGSDLAKQLKIHGFTVPADYSVIRTNLQLLRLPPFDHAPDFTAADIWHKYRWQAQLGLLLIVIIALLTIWLFMLNRRLTDSRQQIQRSASEWHRLITTVGEGVYGVNDKGNCTFINPAALNMLGFDSAEEVIGLDQHKLFHHHREDGSHYPGKECPIHLTLKDGITRNWNDWFWRKDGSGFHVVITAARTGEANDKNGLVVVVFRDNSGQIRLENQLRLEATTDSLTGIANRRYFISQINVELERFKRFKEPAVLIMADIDYFKKINDSYGHAIGDEVLKHFSKLLSGFFRNTDFFGRLGGEEFGVILPVTTVKEAKAIAQRCRLLVESTPAETEKGKIYFTISMGLAEFNLSDEVHDSILTRADIGLYNAKGKGRNTIEFCSMDEAEQVNKKALKSVVSLQWKPAYMCGEDKLDQEHQELFRLSNTLLGQATQPEISEAITKRAFDRLLNHIKSHFKHEEEILRSKGYKDLEQHAMQHKQLIDQAVLLRQQVEKETANMDGVVDFLITKVVAGHLLHEDQKFYHLFRS